MTDRDDSLDAFISALDAINDFCEARVHDRGEENACKDCVLNDYCLNIPSRESYKAAFMSVDKCMELIRRAKEEDLNMGKIRDDEPVVIFCNEAMKATLVEYEPAVSDAAVVTDVVDPGEVVVVPVKEFREWLYSRKENDDPNKTV